jgi:Ca2+-transporting ATPase
MFVSSLLGFPMPLRPIQILWINLITDGLPAMALGVEPAEPDVMQRPPRPPEETMFGRRQRFLIFAQGALVAFSTLTAFVISLRWRKIPIEQARVLTFTVLSVAQLFHVFNCRSEKISVFRRGFISNPYLLMAVGSSILLQLMVLYFPPLQIIFRTAPLGILDWIMVLGLGSIPLWAMELYKKLGSNKK